MAVNVGEIALNAGISAGMSAVVGFVVRMAIERKFSQARLEAEQRRKRRIRFSELRQAWQQAAGRVLYHLVRRAAGKEVNGDLEESFRKLETVEAELKRMERTFAAEAQEE